MIFPWLFDLLLYCVFVYWYHLLISFFFRFLASVECHQKEWIIFWIFWILIPHFERLMLTLHYLACGDSQRWLACFSRTGKKTVSSTLRETCEVLVQVLEPLYLSPPFTLKNWKEISKGYEDLRQFPHILAEHSMKEDVQIEATAKTGSLCRILQL